VTDGDPVDEVVAEYYGASGDRYRDPGSDLLDTGLP
jgi:hypothetical protein